MFNTTQDTWSECTRLIANSIIYYNSFILSELLKKKGKEKLYDDIEVIRNISPVAWRHINLYGTFEFNKQKSFKNINEFLRFFENGWQSMKLTS